MKVKIILILIGLLFTVTSAKAQTWQETLQSSFDYVDTFDHYDDWQVKINSYESPVYSINNNQSWWGPYEARFFQDSQLTAGPLAITDWGHAHQVGTKSLVLNGTGLNSPTYTGHSGPSLVCVYFGENNNSDGSSGYDEVYIFQRIYLANNSVPTDQETPDTKIYKYVSGHEYLPTNGHKMILLGSGFTATNAYHDSVNNRIIRATDYSIWSPYRYGDSETWLYLYSSTGSNNVRDDLQMSTTLRSSHINVSEFDYPDDRGWSEITDQLGAVEIHAKLETNPSSAYDGHNGLLEVWTYQADGTAELQMRSNTASFKSSESQAGHKFNRLCFDGNFRVQHDCGTPCVNNKDIYFTAGSGLETGWWVDDIIINDSRIGPTYFALLSGQPVPEPGPEPDPVVPQPFSFQFTRQAKTTHQDTATLTLYTPGASNPLYTISNKQTNSQGLASNVTPAETIPAGTHDIQIKIPYYLPKKLTNQTWPPTNTLNFGILKAGDTNNDNLINSSDLAIILSNWQTNNATSDLNQDGMVNSLDFSYINANWNRNES